MQSQQYARKQYGDLEEADTILGGGLTRVAEEIWEAEQASDLLSWEMRPPYATGHVGSLWNHFI